MREIADTFNRVMCYLLRLSIVKIKSLWVFFHNVDKQLLNGVRQCFSCLLLLHNFEAFDSSIIIIFGIFPVTSCSMLLDLSISTLYWIALRTREYQLLKYFFDYSMQIHKALIALALFARPLSKLGNHIVAAVKAEHCGAFRAFFWLEYYVVANLAHKMVYHIR